MIQIAFMTGARKIIRFVIVGKTITYRDDLWPSGIQIMPENLSLIQKLLGSRKPNLITMAHLIIDSNKGDNLKEYEKCNTEQELADMIRKDCTNKGLMEVK